MGLPATKPSGQFTALATRLNVDEGEAKSLIKNMLMAAKKDRQGNEVAATDTEVMTFVAIANEYHLNPLTKEIHAFNNRGAIQAIVSVDGWLKIINNHPQFDGMEFSDEVGANGELISIVCRIFRKDRSRPTEVVEYMNECRGISEPWKKWPSRMLRHKATIQAARYAFGLSNIIDEDEADRYKNAKDVTPDSTPQLDRPSTSLKQAMPEVRQEHHNEPATINQSGPDFGLPSIVKTLIDSINCCNTPDELTRCGSDIQEVTMNHPDVNFHEARRAYGIKSRALSGQES